MNVLTRWILLIFVLAFSLEGIDTPAHAEVPLKRPWSITGNLRPGSFLSPIDGANIGYFVIDVEANSTSVPVVISPGRGETLLRYYPMIHAMQKRGFGPFLMIDHRGQGSSMDAAMTDPGVLDVEQFEHYIVDFLAFAEGRVPEELAKRGVRSKPLYLAHSMGGAILNLALVDRPDLARAAIYIAPMFDIDIRVKDIKLKVFKDIFARSISGLLCSLGFARANLKMGRPPTGEPQSFDAKDCSLNDIRHVEQLLGQLNTGATVRWVSQALAATQKIQKLNESGQSPVVPSLIVMGSRDKIVENKGLEKYVAQARNCELVSVGAGHAIHNGKAAARDELVEVIHDFVDRTFVRCGKDLIGHSPQGGIP